ncbi:diacylglycerol kinase family protein [Seonamhaeicola sp.]|uniref:diacylglycerol/lipid kinase family protein n=1 Tax=Seonamhaeicola sp. TaxID=1912245 RepID=UPI00260609AC|nr:diacylglycerol kinase family protein [Seonamhaeicola sp.]
MEDASKKWFVIVNPTSGNGKAKRKWPNIERLLKQHQFDFEFAFTQYEKHSVYLVQKAIRDQFKHIICVGSDGTLHNTVNGIMAQKLVSSQVIQVGVIPIGTGNDWVKTYNIPNTMESAIEIIKKGHIASQDIGKIEFENDHREPIYFNNLAGVGFDGYVVSRVETYKKWGALAYLIGALSGMFSFRNFNTRLHVNSKVISGKTLMILIGICQYSGGGMQLTHTPNPSDGLFDISYVGNLNKLEIIKNLPKLFNGTITNYKKVKIFKAASVRIELTGKSQPLIQADGELTGTGNFKVSVIPRAFSFYTS